MAVSALLKLCATIRAPKLFLYLQAFSDVLDHDGCIDNRSVGVSDRRHRRGGNYLDACLRAGALLNLPHLPLTHVGRHIPKCFAASGMREFFQRSPNELATVIFENTTKHGIDLAEAALGIQDAHAEGRLLEHRPEPLLTRLKLGLDTSIVKTVVQ